MFQALYSCISLHTIQGMIWRQCDIHCFVIIPCLPVSWLEAAGGLNLNLEDRVYLLYLYRLQQTVGCWLGALREESYECFQLFPAYLITDQQLEKVKGRKLYVFTVQLFPAYLFADQKLEGV